MEILSLLHHSARRLEKPAPKPRRCRPLNQKGRPIPADLCPAAGRGPHARRGDSGSSLDPSKGSIEKGGYELAEQNGRTRLTLSAQSEYTGFLPRLFEPLITPAAQKKLEGDLARLKSLVEGEAAMPGTTTP